AAGTALAGAHLSGAGRALLGAGFLCSATYALPLPGGGSVKTIPGLKAPFVGFAVASAVVLLPALDASPSPEAAGVAWLILTLGLCATVNALLFDTVDVEEDRQADVPSAPRLLGARGVRRLCAALLLTATL